VKTVKKIWLLLLALSLCLALASCGEEETVSSEEASSETFSIGGTGGIEDLPVIDINSLL